MNTLYISAISSCHLVTICYYGWAYRWERFLFGTIIAESSSQSPIVAWKCNFLPLLDIMTAQTNRPTNRHKESQRIYASKKVINKICFLQRSRRIFHLVFLCDIFSQEKKTLYIFPPLSRLPSKHYKTISQIALINKTSAARKAVYAKAEMTGSNVMIEYRCIIKFC